MSLSTALGTARSSLFNTARQTSVVAQNIANSQNPDYNKRTAVLVSTGPGARVAEIHRAANDLLYRHNISALSGWEGQATLLAGIENLGLSVNGTDNASSPAALLGQLQNAIQLYSASPSNRSLGESAVETGRQLASALNSGSNAIQKFRSDADAQIATAVGELNGLLSSFDAANTAVVNGTRAGRDVSDALDHRDSLLKQIAQYVPVSTLKRGDNDMVVMSTGGSVLYETTPRTVSFQPTNGFAAGVTGNPVVIDGVPIAGATTDATGRISALVQLRDGVSDTMQRQLDEIARGLVTAFSETDQSGGALPALAGLFTWSGGPSVPAAGTIAPGIAATIAINAAYDPARGGNPSLLRDGGANGIAYVFNTDGNASFTDRLIQLGDLIDTPMAFSSAASAGDTASLSDFTTNVINWFEGLRQQAFRAEESKNALMTRTAEALSNATGVNVDEEMALLLELEHSYQASARILSAIDEMLAVLIQAVR